MKKLWAVLGIVLIVIIGVFVSNYSVELSYDNVGFLEIGIGGQPSMMGLEEDNVKDLTDDLNQLTFHLSRIKSNTLDAAKFDIYVRDKSGKGRGVVRVYDETNISYTKSVLGIFSLEYQAKDGSLDLKKLSLLSQ
ncbi:hypothetical protein [Turicibacter sanguinis]|uniref:hypothetical protein n=2 Tax=Turicibacter sanguinis TaxID=154288 RepID=UPI0018A0FA98|nr:hypothetical protein [Turicibacter sanguinis]